MKKRISSIVLAVLMIVSLLPVGALAEGPADLELSFVGNGTEGYPYKLATIDDLAKLAEIVNGGESCADTYFELTANIGDNASHVTTVIGDSTATPFEGHFDGKGCTVNLGITSSASNIGLFGSLGSGGTIANVTTLGSVTGMYYVGGVCGYNNGGTITNCDNSCVVTGLERYVGGVCGRNNGGSITNCNNFNKVSGSDYSVGGVCGDNSEGSITNCYSIGDVTGDRYIGGICGENSKGTITNCSNSSYVTGKYVGGVCGYNSEGSITNCFNSSSVSNSNESGDVGGICGENSKGTITNCYNSGGISGSGNYVGGVCGDNNSGTITDCYYDKEVCGGIVNGAEGAVKGSDDATNRVLGLTTAQCTGKEGEKFNTAGEKDQSGTELALIDKLNGCHAYRSGWRSWAPVQGGYPTFGVHIHDFAGDYVQGTGDNLGKHGQKCVVDGCTVAGDYEAWQYRVDTTSTGNDTITAFCEVCGRSTALTLLPHSGGLVYNGSAFPAGFNSREKAAWEKAVGSVPEIYYHDDTKDADMGTTAPANAGTYTAEITAGTGESAKTAQISFTIQKATLFMQVFNKTAMVGDASAPSLDDPKENIDYKFLKGPVGTDSENITVSLSYADTPDLSAAGTTAITATVSGDAAGNYDVTVVNGTLTVSGSEHTHTYGTATYIWHDGLSQCTAIKTCQCGYAVIETVNTTKSGNTITADFSEAFTDQTKTVEEAEHVHTPELVEGQAPTCTADGWKNYYQCEDNTCNKYFSDPACENEIINLDTWKTGDGKIAATGHKAVNIPEKAATETADGYKTYWYCPVCNSYYTDAACTNKIDDIEIWKTGEGKIESGSAHEHTYDKTAASPRYLKSAATCTEPAVYYKSCECGEASTTDTFTSGSALGHSSIEIPQQDATTEKDGVKAYWYCGNCKRYFEDEACTNEILDLNAWKIGDGKINMLTAHEHTFANEWSSNACAHWHASTCTHDGYNVIKDGGAHDFDGGVPVEDGTKYTCKICSYIKTVSESGEVCRHENLRYVNNKNGTHKVICDDCTETLNASAPCVYDQAGGTKCICGANDPSQADVKISVDVKEKTQKKYVGFWLFGYYKNVTTYTATIKTESAGVKVTKVQYQLNGSSKWITGSNVCSDKPIKTLNIRAWDNTGKVYEYTYTKGK